MKKFLMGMISLMIFLGISTTTNAATAPEINIGARNALDRLYYRYPEAQNLTDRAAGVLVFPSVFKAGLGFGGEYGEGVLIRRGRQREYYNLISASFGFQLGIQSRTVILIFMTEKALNNFRSTRGWKIGVDGSVAIINLGVGGNFDTNELVSPVIAMVMDPTGLMYNLTLEGSKISRIVR